MGKSFLAGMIAKWALLNVCVFLVESMMPSCVCSASLPFQHWVRSHRMARDMLVSLVVVLPQLPLVLLVALDEHVCPGCGAHQLLIYRDPGTVERQEKVFEMDLEGGEVKPVVSPLVMPDGAEGTWADWFNSFAPAQTQAPTSQTMQGSNRLRAI